MLRQALSLWRGKPLADAADRAFARGEIRRLENSYRAAVIARVQADVQRGLYRSVIGELEAMSARWPDDEAVRELLVGNESWEVPEEEQAGDRRRTASPVR